MTVNSHIKGSKGSHDRLKEDASTVGIKGVCQKEFDKEVIEIKERLSKMMKLLQEEDENQRCGQSGGL